MDLFSKSMRGFGRPVSDRSWWRERFVTLMLVPERTRRVYKLVVPFFVFKITALIGVIAFFAMILVGADYLHVLTRLSENKRLKGENFRLRQELQSIQNKVDSLETTVERVRNYAKKLQVLTGQGERQSIQPGRGLTSPIAPEDKGIQRGPASRSRTSDSGKNGKLENISVAVKSPLETRLEDIAHESEETSIVLAHLQTYFLAQSAVLAATPSLLPINGWLSSAFGYRRHPYDGSYRLHAGVDIVADSGTPVRAPADGTVLFAGNKSGYGKVVVVDHGYGIRTVHGHVSRFFVTAGSKLKRGDKIAEVGSTGKATGPHLHYEIRKNGVPVNPTSFFSASAF